eukprot:CCRYP_015760-RA/>CCRYP_015760-RA protein AED:0.47 eAED:1.00 QI:0/0/0/1/0/0/2/0/62
MGQSKADDSYQSYCQRLSLRQFVKPKNISTLAGKLQVQEVVTLRDLRLPEFDKTGESANKRL